MILILSHSYDQSTNNIIEWLNYYNQEWFRVNEDDNIAIDVIEYKDNEIVKFEISVNGFSLNLLAVKSYWFRRGWLNNDEQRISIPVSPDPVIHANVVSFLNEEIENLIDFIHAYLRETKVTINSFTNSRNNKSYYQFIAMRVGLNVPNSLISCTKEQLTQFKRANNKIITKNVNEQLAFFHNNESYTTTTSPITDADIEESGAKFYPSFFQKYVEKFIELRVFYIHEEIYAMAIFSQQNEKTKIDFRNYDDVLPNRNVPFSLPEEVEKKIIDFMKTINQNSGSLDLILTPENEYIFLEVNPVGQFGMVSFPCNYYLEKRIAQLLMR